MFACREENDLSVAQRNFPDHVIFLRYEDEPARIHGFDGYLLKASATDMGVKTGVRVGKER